jgi:hypothetical protein
MLGKAEPDPAGSVRVSLTKSGFTQAARVATLGQFANTIPRSSAFAPFVNGDLSCLTDRKLLGMAATYPGITSMPA